MGRYKSFSSKMNKKVIAVPTNFLKKFIFAKIMV